MFVSSWERFIGMVSELKKNQISDNILIVSNELDRANAISSDIHLRDAGDNVIADFEQAASYLKSNTPMLMVVEAGQAPDQVTALLEHRHKATEVMVLASQFDEDWFLTLHDQGVREYIVQPVSSSYLFSRILLFLEEQHLKKQVQARNDVLQELGMVSERSGSFSTSFMLEMLKKESDQLLLDPQKSLSVMVVQMAGYPSPLKGLAESRVYEAVSEKLHHCARGKDIVGEYFEDKFIVVLPGTPLVGAQSLSQRVAHQLNGFDVDVAGKTITLQARCGVAEYVDCRHYEDLLNKALRDMVQHKNVK